MVRIYDDIDQKNEEGSLNNKCLNVLNKMEYGFLVF